MKSSTRFSSTRSAATEIVTIVIGVLLALGVNEWNENRIHTERAAEAIQNVIQEINSNIKFVNIVNANNQRIIELIKNQGNGLEDQSNEQFIPGLQIQDTAWKMLHSTGVSEFIDYPTLYEISTIYSLQDIYKSMGYQLVQTITNNRALVASIAPDRSSTVDNKLFLSEMMLIVEIEKALLSSYTKTLEKLINR